MTELKLRAEMEALEHEVGELRAKLAKPTLAQRGRTTAAVLLLIAAMLLAPIALVATWARAELVNTDRFVSTFAPLASDSDVQAFITREASDAITENVGIDELVGEAFAGIEALDLPPKASAALELLEGPAAEGIRSMIHSGVERAIASPQFAQLWAGVLSTSHAQAIAVLQGDPAALAQISDDGTLSLQLGVVVDQVKQDLAAQGMGFAEHIPEVDRSIPLLQSDSLVAARAVYQGAVALGNWLPWVVLGLFAAGLIAARNRVRTLMWTGIGLAASLLLLGAGLGTGKLFFLAEVSPTIMPAGAASALFGQLTGLVSSVITALVFFSVVVSVAAWALGTSRAAVSLRGWTNARFREARAGLDRIGVRSADGARGVWGRGVEQARPAITVLASLAAVLAVFLIRPTTVASVFWATVTLAAVLLLVELVRRPAAENSESSS